MREPYLKPIGEKIDRPINTALRHYRINSLDFGLNS